MKETIGEAKPACGQCGKPAIMMIGSVPLCVDCEYKYQQSRYLVFVQNAAMLNHADGELVKAIGMPYLSNPIEIPPAPVPPIDYSNQSVSVSGGVVGAINIGANVEEIQVEIGTLTQGGAVAQAEALAAVTNAVLEDAQLQDAEKNNLLEQIAFLSKQAATPASERKSGVLSSVLAGIKDTAGAAGAVATAWAKAEPIIKGYLELS